MSAMQRLSKSKPKSQMHVQRSTSEPSSADAGTASSGVSGFYSAGPVLSLVPPVQAKHEISPFNDPSQQEPREQEPDVTAIQTKQLESQGDDGDNDEELTGEIQQQSKSLQRQLENENEDIIQAEQTSAQAGSPATDSSSIHAIASEGLRGAERGLPGQEHIQASFGRHDISSTRVQVGGPAEQANDRLGSRAYTRGDRIAFKEEPDLKLAAHEAAHVVQQRSGVRLKDGIGRPGDKYEQQADAAAERVVANQSAEDLLNDNDGEQQTALQTKCDCGGTCSKCAGQQLADEEQDAIQMDLEINAHHLFEESLARSAVSPEGEPGAEGANESESSEENGGEGESRSAATATGDTTSSSASEEGGSRSTAAPTATATPATAAEGGETSADQSSQTGTPSAPATAPTGGATTGGEPPQTASGCTPECYREPSEEPAEEPEERPPNPPQGEVEAEASEGDEEDLPELDECPAEGAEAAAGATSEAPEAATAASAPEAAGLESSTGTSEGAGPAGAGGSSPGSALTAGAMAVSNASPLDGVIAEAESQRGIAVSAYGESSSALRGASAKTRVLRSGVQFTVRSGESGAEQERRRSAANRADTFFLGIANRLDEAIGYALTDIPDQLGALAESAKAQIDASIERQKIAVSMRIEQARGQAMADAAMARRAVHVQAATYIADVEAATSAAIESLTATHSETMGQVNELETSTLDSINEIYAAGRTDLEGLGTIVGDECTAKGDAFATEYEGFRSCTEDGFWDGNLAERRANAQADAARSIAGKYRDRMVDAAKKRAREVTRNGRKTDRCSIIAAANQSRDTLDEQLPALANALEATRDAAIQQAGVTENSLISSINSSLAATLSQLDQQERTQRQAVNDTGYMQQVLQEQIAHGAAAAVQKGVQTAVNSVQQALLDLKARFASSNPPDTVVLERVLSQVEQRINMAMEGLHTSTISGAAAAQNQLAIAAQQAMTSLEDVTQSNDELTATLSDGFSSAMNGLAGTDNFATQRTAVTDQIQQSTTAGNNALAQILEGLRQSCDGRMQGAQTALTEAHASLEQNLRQSKQGLECEITRKADEAASKEAPAWKRVLAVVLIIIVVIIVIAVTVITAGAAGPVIVAALGGPLLAGAIIGAAVGAVVSGLIAMATNLWNNRNVMEGVGKAVLIGFITGAAGGFIGAAAGAGAGLLFQGASKAVQAAAQFGAAMISAGGFDVVTQWVMNGFSFEHFSWASLGTTLVITALTFGLAHQVSARAAAGAPHPAETPEPVPTAETPEPVSTTEARGAVSSAHPAETPASAAVPETPPVTPHEETPPVVTPREEVPAVPPKPSRMGTVSAGPEGVVEHAPSSPVIEQAPAGRRGPSAPPEASASPRPEPVPEPTTPRRSTSEEIAEVYGEETSMPPEAERAEFEARADEIREQMNPRTSRSSTRAEREQATTATEQDRAARRAPIDEESGSYAPEERPSEMFDDPNAPTPRSGEPLNRPGLRDETKAIIEASAETNEHGQFVDSEGNVINEPDYGHVYGHENRRIVAAGEELGLTQEQLNEYVNSRPEFFQIEEHAVNISHENEMPGLEPYDHIVADMESFFGL